MTLVLYAGLAALFASLAAVVGLIATADRQDRGVLRGLATVQAIHIDNELIAPEPFSERVIAPAMQRLSKVARRLSPAGVSQRLAHRLDVAGNPAGWNVERLLAFKGVGLVALPALALLLFGSVGGGTLLLAPLAGAAAGFYLPDLLVYNAGLRRQEQIQRSLPDALDLLTISVEAGLGFDAALAQVAKNTTGPLAGEFFRVLQEMQIGKSRTEAFRAVTDRTTVPELISFISSLTQSDELGIPIAHVLREQANEMRVKRHQRAEEAAQKVPVKILFPMILFILPALFVVIIGPGVITIAHNFKTW